MNDKTQPLLELSKDYTQINTIKDSITIEGVTDANDSIVVEAITVPENKDNIFSYAIPLKDGISNTFSCVVPLEDGMNLIDITVIDEYGNTNQCIASVYKITSVEESFPTFKVVVVLLFLLMLFFYVIDSIKNNMRKCKDYVKVKMRITKGVVKDMISLFIPLIVIFVICKFVLCITVIQSGSMEPTILTGDTVVINRLAYVKQDVKRGDIIFFESSEFNATFGKRVIGLPGDVVEFKDGYVVINGQSLDESTYIDENVDTNSFKVFEVPENCYFVLGDNREVSNDSRFWLEPYIDKKDIIGKYISVLF